MTDFLITEDQEKALLKLLPDGKIYQQAFTSGSQFNLFIQFLGKYYNRQAEIKNEVFKGLFPCTMGYLIEEWKRDYSIPNDIFYFDPDYNDKDIFVLKYLMKGNTSWHFIAIASIYDIDIKLHLDTHTSVNTKYPARFPQRFTTGQEKIDSNIYISLTRGGGQFPYPLPLSFGDDKRISSIKKIFNIIKQAQCSIVYDDLTQGEAKEQKIIFCKDI